MNKKRMTKRKRKFILILLFFTIIVLSGSSYAWFTANRIVTIRTINVHVEASGGIEISADGTKWKTILLPEDIISVHDTTYPTSVNQLPKNMIPVSTGKTIDSSTGFLMMYRGVTDSNEDGEYILTSERSIETESNGENSNGHFIAFDMFLKASNPSDLYMTKESKVDYLNEDSKKGIAAATRVAFVIEGNVPTSADVSTIQSLKGGTSDKTYIWEPNYDVHTLSGINNASNVYGINTTQTGATRINYDGVISEISKTSNVLVGNAKAANFPGLFRAVNIDYPTVKDFENNVQVFSIEGGVTKIRVYMWIEGQDVDCENDASYDDITFDLQLTVNPN